MPLWNGTDRVKVPKPRSRCEETLKAESALRKGFVFSSRVGGSHATGCAALPSEIALGLKRDQRGEDAKPSASFEARSLWNGGKTCAGSLAHPF